MAGMKLSMLMAAGLPLVTPLFAGEKSGHATAELLCGVTSYQAGKAVPVGVKLTMDPGWHSYWINPGVGGMPLSAKWTLPEGWTAGELQQPVPKRFMTGELPGFGYEGEAVFLVDLTPPAGAAGEAECKVKLSWLTCNDNACVPGDVELAVKLPAGDGAAGKDAPAITAASAKIPAVVSGVSLDVRETGESLVLTLNAPKDLDLEGASAFPATPEVIDPAAPLVFQRSGETWTVTAPKNEYAEGPATLLEVVLAGGKLPKPLAVTWRSK